MYSTATFAAIATVFAVQRYAFIHKTPKITATFVAIATVFAVKSL